MRCPKCGYISFDHLSECEKCSEDLTASRQELGVPGLKPAMPAFLGSLLKVEEEVEQNVAETPPAEIEPVFGWEDEDEEPAAGPEPDISLPEPDPAWADEAVTAEDDMPEITLADDDGEDAAVTLNDDVPVIEFSDDDLEPYLGVKPSAAAGSQQDQMSPAGTSETADSSDQEMVIELSDDDLEGLLLELEDDSEEEDQPESKTAKE